MQCTLIEPSIGFRYLANHKKHISALLYLFIAEILAIKLKTNNDIKGIRIANMSTEIKNLQHADDVTLALRDMLSLEKAIETVKSFCDHAGSKVHLNKTQCILLGKLKGKHSNIGKINVTNDAVRCLGIFIGHDKEQCFDLNWKKITMIWKNFLNHGKKKTYYF